MTTHVNHRLGWVLVLTSAAYFMVALDATVVATALPRMQADLHVGLTSLHAFGPLFRFVAGCGAAARRVSSAVARRAAPRPSFLPRPSPRPILGSSPSSGQ